MIEYPLAEDPDNRILSNASVVLKSGGLVVFPTDTNWIVACDPFSKKGPERFYQLKKERSKLKHFSLICDSISKASEVAYIHNTAFRKIRNKVPGHYTFIFLALKKITRVVQASKTDHEIGVRFVPSVFVNRFLEFHDEVLLTTQITPEMLNLSEGDQIYSYHIEDAMKGKIDLILDPGEYDFVGPSTVIDFTDEGESGILVRQGAGVWP